MVRTALKIVGYCMGILMLFFCLAIWQKFFFYPKAWKAQVTVDGRACSDCAVYVHRSRLGDGGVLVRRDRQTSELYSVAFPNSEMGVPKGAVWKCVDGAFSFVPGLAYTSVYRSCTPRPVWCPGSRTLANELPADRVHHR
jgi:hypothetical protein